MSENSKVHIKLVIDDPQVKKNYFEFLRDTALIPVCRNCGKLFDLGFPDTEEGVADNLICHENGLICSCEYFRIVKNLFSTKEDGVIDIHTYYLASKTKYLN